eukprot:4431293-Pyramimonas_sp.AAC.1
MGRARSAPLEASEREDPIKGGSDWGRKGSAAGSERHRKGSGAGLEWLEGFRRGSGAGLSEIGSERGSERH